MVDEEAALQQRRSWIRPLAVAMVAAGVQLSACSSSGPIGEGKSGDSPEAPAVDGLQGGGTDTGTDTGTEPPRELAWEACPDSDALLPSARCAALSVPLLRMTEPAPPSAPPPDEGEDEDEDEDEDGDDGDDGDDDDDGGGSGSDGPAVMGPGSDPVDIAGPDGVDPGDDPEDGSPVVDLKLIELPAIGPARGTLWVIDGGPGGTGLRLARDADSLAALRAAGFAVRIPAHRGSRELRAPACGTGVGTATSCGTALMEDFGGSLAGFVAAEAAEDLQTWLAADDRVGPDILWGQSYGTYVVQLLMAGDPGAADGVILDSVLPLDAELELVNVWADAPVRRFLDSCTASPRCAAESGGDPEALAQRAVASGCSPFATSGRAGREELVRGLISSEYAALAVPFLRMLDRCSEADVAALSVMIDAIDELSPSPAEFNGALGYNVTMMDLWRPAHSPALVEAMEARLLLPGSALDGLYRAAEVWAELPRVALPESLGAWHAPVLLLQGGRDLQTTTVWADRMGDRIAAPGFTEARFPWGGHVLFESAADPTTAACVEQIVLDFALGPGDAPALDCIDGLPAIDHDAVLPETQERSRTLFGVSDPWIP